jgi:hypothetical protein
MSCSISRMRAAAVRGSAQQRGELLGLARVEAGGRLVEAEQHRVGAHGARDLEPPLLAIGQGAGGVVGALDQAGRSSQCAAFSIAARSARR